MSPYATPITVVPRKSNPGAPLAEIKRLYSIIEQANSQSTDYSSEIKR